MSTGIDLPAKPDADESVKKSWADGVVDALSGHDGIVGTLMDATVPNGSFESYETGSDTPNNWTLTLLQNGAATKETTSPYHGATAYKFTRVLGTGNGGATLESSQFIPVGGNYVYEFSAQYFASAAILSSVNIEWYEKDKTTLVSTDSIVSIALATAWREVFNTGYAPGAARFCKIKIIGGDTGTDVAGYCLFDDITFKTYPLRTVLDGQEYTHTGDTVYTNVASFPIAVPTDCTTISVTVKAKFANGGGGGTGYYRARLNATDGTEESVTQSSYSDETSDITVAAGDKGEVHTLYIRLKTSVNTSTTYARLDSVITNGYEHNIKIT